MLVKVKIGDKTIEFDSKEHLIAILLDPGSKESIKNMEDDQQLILTGPLSIMRNGTADAWQWAMTDWHGAKLIPGHVLGANGNILNG